MTEEIKIRKSKKYFNTLEESDFCHPHDLSALSVLKKARGLDSVITWISKWSYEKVNRIMLMGNTIKATSTTYTRLYNMMTLACDILNMPLPELYVQTSGEIQAYTSGTGSPVIVITTALVESCEEEEILAAIAHELGHIKARHILYSQVASVLTRGTKMLGPIKKLLDVTLLVSLRSWSRKSELTADRAALLVTQNPKSVVSMLMKISGGSKSLNKEISPEDFIRQSEEYDRLENSMTGNALKLFITLSETHPFPVMRVSELMKWSHSEEYQTLLENGDDVPKHQSREENERIKNFRLTALSPATIQLKWEAPNVFGVDHYVIHRNINDYDFEVYKTVSGGTFQFKDKLSQKGFYKYYISACNHTGDLFGDTDVLLYEVTELDEPSLQEKLKNKFESFL